MSDDRPRIAVCGLGYVGLPVAQAATAAGCRVVGFDVSAIVVDSLNRGTSHVDDINDTTIVEMLGSGFAATNNAADLEGCDVFVICVPTPLTDRGGPDLSAITELGRTLSGIIDTGSLVVLESTSYPGTTETVLLPLLEEGGLVAGRDFALAFSPERIDPGNPIYSLSNTPKIVGGLTESCTAKAADFYGLFVDSVVVARGLREAELAKLLENTYRQINIALVNEMAMFCNDLGIDLWDTIRCASSKPFGFQTFYPGPGVGGHCIPIDPRYLDHYVRARTGHGFRFVELAQDINANMPFYVAGRVKSILNRAGIPLVTASVLVLGITYKPNVADTRESPAVAVVRSLRDDGVRVSFHDPHVATWAVDGEAVMSVVDLDQAVRDTDCVLFLQNHREYDVASLEAHAVRMFDTSGVTTGTKAERL